MNEDEGELIHQTSERFWRKFSMLVNDTLLTVPSHLRYDLEIQLSEKTSIYGRNTELSGSQEALRVAKLRHEDLVGDIRALQDNAQAMAKSLREVELSVHSRGAAVTELSEEVVRLREAIEKVPDASGCGFDSICMCWKSKALVEPTKGSE